MYLVQRLSQRSIRAVDVVKTSKSYLRKSLILFERANQRSAVHPWPQAAVMHDA